jgi:hypothetical protein
MSVYFSKKSSTKYAPLDVPRDPSRLVSGPLASGLSVIIAPFVAVTFALSLLLLWTLAVPLAVMGLGYAYSARFRSPKVSL